MGLAANMQTGQQEFFADPEQLIELCTELYSEVFRRAKMDLKSKNRAIRMDAYYWMACPNSDLYSLYSGAIGADFFPAMFKDAIAEAGLPSVPTGGIKAVELNTDEPNSWCYWGGDESEDAYRAKVLQHHELSDEVLMASLNGCSVTVRGRGARVIYSALNTVGREAALAAG